MPAPSLVEVPGAADDAGDLEAGALLNVNLRIPWIQMDGAMPARRRRPRSAGHDGEDRRAGNDLAALLRVRVFERQGFVGDRDAALQRQHGAAADLRAAVGRTQGQVVADVKHAFRHPRGAGVRVGAREDQGAGARLVQPHRAADDAAQLQRTGLSHENRCRDARGQSVTGRPDIEAQHVVAAIHREAAVAKDQAIAGQGVGAAVKRDRVELRVGGEVVRGS